MIEGILIALLISVIVYALATLAVRKLSPPPEFLWVIWLLVIIVIIFVWWNRVLGALIGPLP